MQQRLQCIESSSYEILAKSLCACQCITEEKSKWGVGVTVKAQATEVKPAIHKWDVFLQSQHMGDDMVIVQEVGVIPGACHRTW